MVSQYLAQLETELCKELPVADVRAVLAETEVHLRSRVQALVELGLDPVAAEQESVQVFGNAIAYSRSIADASPNGSRTAEAAVMRVAMVTTFAALLLVPLTLLILRPEPLLLVAPLVLGLVAASTRTRSIIPLKLMLPSVVATVLLVLIMGLIWIDLNSFGGHGVVSRLEAGAYRQKWSAPAGAGDIPSLGMDETMLRENLLALDSAARAPLWVHVAKMAPQVAPAGIAWLGALWCSNLIGVMLGRLRRRRAGPRRIHA